MNLRFLGDALDHWKGSLIGSLQDAGILRSLFLDPMASDATSWRPEDVEVYARLLRVDRSQIVEHRVNLNERDAYFHEIPSTDDLFLDPDTGIATGAVREPTRYVTPPEVWRLFQVSENRLLLVYQHVRAQKVSDRVDKVLAALWHHSGGQCGWCSYESAGVAMLFLARQPERTAALVAHFHQLLGRHGKGRIRDGGA